MARGISNLSRTASSEGTALHLQYSIPDTSCHITGVVYAKFSNNSGISLPMKVPADHGVKVEGTRNVLPEEFVASDFDVMVISMDMRLMWCRENLGP
jgi:hypothetical protein